MAVDHIQAGQVVVGDSPVTRASLIQRVVEHPVADVAMLCLVGIVVDRSQVRRKGIKVDISHDSCQPHGRASMLQAAQAQVDVSW